MGGKIGTTNFITIVHKIDSRTRSTSTSKYIAYFYEGFYFYIYFRSIIPTYYIEVLIVTDIKIKYCSKTNHQLSTVLRITATVNTKNSKDQTLVTVLFFGARAVHSIHDTYVYTPVKATKTYIYRRSIYSSRFKYV